MFGELWFDSRKRQRDSSLLQIFHTDCGVYSASCSLDTGDCAPVRGLVGMWSGCLKLTAHPYLLLSFRNVWFCVYCSPIPIPIPIRTPNPTPPPIDLHGVRTFVLLLSYFSVCLRYLCFSNGSMVLEKNGEDQSHRSC